MPKKRITFILIPSKNGQVREYRVSTWLPWICSIASFSFVVASIYFTVGYAQRQDQQNVIDDLTTRNEELIGLFDLTELKVAKLDQDMEELVETDDKLRAFHQMDAISPEERQLGVGGPEVLPDVDFMAVPEYKRLSLEHLNVKIERLRREAKQQAESYNQIMTKYLASGDSLRHLPTVYPVPKSRAWESSQFDKRIDPFTGRTAFHTGIDFAGRKGTPIIATADGVVTHAYKDKRLGNVIVIEHNIEGVDDEGISYTKEGIFRTEYGHLDKMLVSKGEKVKRHQTIGLMGSTGRSTGPHLHYAVRHQDRSKGRYKGYVDPADFLLDAGGRDRPAAGWLGAEEQ
jgi:murein DD-endopeptidase MepM/ murein hydrolase activator NlpD